MARTGRTTLQAPPAPKGPPPEAIVKIEPTKPKPSEVLADPDEVLDQYPPPKNKADAVRAVLAEDPDISPKDGVALIRERYGIEMSAATFSVNKSAEKKKAGGGNGSDRHEAEAPTGAGGLSLDAARAVKKYLDTHGEESLSAAMDLFSRYGASGVRNMLEFIRLVKS